MPASSRKGTNGKMQAGVSLFSPGRSMTEQTASRLSCAAQRSWQSKALLLCVLLCSMFGETRALAQTGAAAPSQLVFVAIAPQDITQAQADLYERWRANIRANQPVAYAAGREYLAQYPNNEYAAYVKKWVDDYERAARRLQFQKLLIKDKQFAAAFNAGKEVLADDPGNLKTLLGLAYAGYFAQTAGDSEMNAETRGYAINALDQLDAGNQPSDWQPFKSREDALGYLHFIAGDLVLRDTPADALSSFLKALQYDGSIKTYPVIYARLAGVYTINEYEPLAKDFAARYSGKEITPESQAALDKIYGVVDKIIDAYARAVALSGDEPQYTSVRSRWLEQLTGFYKTRHNNTTDGLDALLAGVTAKPLP